MGKREGSPLMRVINREKRQQNKCTLHKEGKNEGGGSNNSEEAANKLGETAHEAKISIGRPRK